MGIGIVNREKVEFMMYRHTSHFRRQSQGIRGMFKKRVVQHLHFVKMDFLACTIQFDRNGIADEMNFVSPACQLFTDFCSDNPAATIGWITSDADFQFSPPWLKKLTGSWMPIGSLQ